MRRIVKSISIRLVGLNQVIDGFSFDGFLSTIFAGRIFRPFFLLLLLLLLSSLCSVVEKWRLIEAEWGIGVRQTSFADGKKEGRKLAC